MYGKNSRRANSRWLHPPDAVKAAPWKDPQRDPLRAASSASPNRFGDFKAVDDVSLKIYKGEIFCLLGASGCGKTTLLRMLGGFETPTSGRIFIDGEDMTRRAARTSGRST